MSALKLIESIAAILIPGARREDVLGDLAQRYVSTRRYLIEVLRTVPLVIAIQIRRTSDWRLVLAEGCGLYCSLVAAVSWFAGSSFALQDSTLLWLAAPALTGMIALILRDAYASSSRTAMQYSLFDSVFGAAASFAVSIWLLPAWIMSAAFIIAVGILSPLRWLLWLERVESAGLPAKAYATAWRLNALWLLLA